MKICFHVCVCIFLGCSSSYAQSRTYNVKKVSNYLDTEIGAKGKLLEKLDKHQKDAERQMQKSGLTVMQDSSSIIPAGDTTLSSTSQTTKIQRSYLVQKAKADSIPSTAENQIKKATKRTEGIKKEKDKLDNKLKELEKLEEQLASRQKQIADIQEKCFGQLKNIPGSDQLKKAEKVLYYWKQRDMGWQNLTGLANGEGKKLLGRLPLDNDFLSFKNDFLKKTPGIPQLPGVGNIPGLGDLLMKRQELEKQGFQTKRLVSDLIKKNTGQSFTEPSLDPKITSGMKQLDSLKAKFPAMKSFEQNLHFDPNPYKGLPLMQRLKVKYNMQPVAPRQGKSGTLTLGLQCSFLWTKRVAPAMGIAYGAEVGRNNEFKLKDHGITGRAGFDIKGTELFSFTCSAEYLFNDYSLPESRYFSKEQTTNSSKFYAGLTINTGKLTKGRGSLFIGYDLNSIGKEKTVSPFVFRFQL